MDYLTRPTAPPGDGMRDFMLAPTAARPQLPRAGWWCVALLAICFLPRMGLALRQDEICRDGVYYIQLAQALDEKDWSRGFGSIGLNVFPGALVALHALGLDFPTAGELWGVAMASLAVLPLFGWVRRLFDDRVALTTALLYAAHPKLIEWSPALVRDPTFWFLWSASIYCLVRAVTEVRLGWFLLAGGTTALAIHTRFEGWLLYLPWAVWSWRRAQHLVAMRWSLYRGSFAGLAAYPVLLLLVNVTLLHDCPSWQLGSFQRLQYVQWWWQGDAPETAQLPTLPTPPALNSAVTPVRQVPTLLAVAPVNADSWEFVFQYLDALRRGYDLAFGILAAWGIWRWRALWQRGDYLALLVVAVAIFGAIWIHFWYAGATSSRYVLTVVLLALPWTALGCLDLVERALAFAQQKRPSLSLNYATAWSALVALFLVVGSARALTTRDNGLAREAALGRWLAERVPPDMPVAFTKTMPLCAYYAGSSKTVTWLETRDPAWPAMIGNPSLQLAIVESNVVSEAVVAGLAPGWELAPREMLPETCRGGKFVLFVRAGTALTTRNTSPDSTAKSTRKATVGR
jgi:hypothetical protein